MKPTACDRKQGRPLPPFIKGLWYAFLLIILYLLRATPPADFRYWGM